MQDKLQSILLVECYFSIYACLTWKNDIVVIFIRKTYLVIFYSGLIYNNYAINFFTSLSNDVVETHCLIFEAMQ